MDETTLKKVLDEAIAPLQAQIQSLASEIKQLKKQSDNIVELNLLSGSKAYSILGYSSYKALNRASNDGTLRANKEWFDRRKQGSMKPIIVYDIKACKKRLQQISKQVAFDRNA